MKTFLTAIYCVVRAILFPGTKIVVASGIKSQAIELIGKIEELKKDSANLTREISDIRTNSNDPKVEFHNGSWIKIVASNDNARSKRANLLIVDEFRQVDLNVINNVLRKFLSAPRQPGYLNNPKYTNDKQYKERNMEMYLSSAWYSHHWSYKKFMAFFKKLVSGEKYFVCGLPYQLAIREGLYDEDQAKDVMSEDDFDEIGWEMEMGCLWLGESENAYFKFEDLESSRKLSTPIYNNNQMEILKNTAIKKPKKKPDEIRLVSCDIAATEGAANDNSVFSIFKLVKNGNSYDRHVVYMESINGGNTVTQSFRIRELREEFDCDFIVLDTQNVGTGIYDNLILSQFNRETSTEYEALSCINDEAMANRCKVENAPKIIYSIKGTPQLNSNIAINFRDTLRRNKLKLLIHENDAKEYLKSVNGFGNLTVEDKAKILSPYAQATALINEMISLEAEFSDDGKVKLKEPSGKRKDRWSSISYGNWIASELERNLNVKSAFDSEFEDEEYIYT